MTTFEQGYKFFVENASGITASQSSGAYINSINNEVFFCMGKSSREESEKAGSKNGNSDTADSSQILSEGRNII